MSRCQALIKESTEVDEKNKCTFSLNVITFTIDIHMCICMCTFAGNNLRGVTKTIANTMLPVKLPPFLSDTGN